MKQVSNVEAVSSQQILSVLSILAGPLTAVFTVFLQSSYSEYKEKRKAIQGLSYELQANRGTLESFKNNSESVNEIPFQLMNSSFESFLNRGLLDNFPEPIRTEITNIYINKRVLADASDVSSDKSVEETVKSIIKSSKVISDYLDDYYDSWGYDLYLKFICRRFSSWLKNTYGKIRFEIRNRNSNTSLDIEYIGNHVRAEIPDLVFQKDFQED